MTRTVMCLALVFLMLGTCRAEGDPPRPGAGDAGAARRGDRLAPFEALVGAWQGKESAVFGQGEGERSYRWILGGRYLLSENRSVFKPQEGLPEGEVHEDWTIFSYDRGRAAYVARQFNSEGFVNTLVMTPESEPGKRMVFVSESSENAPAGMRARLSLEVAGEGKVVEVFELAEPGQDFKLYVRNTWTKVSK